MPKKNEKETESILDSLKKAVDLLVHRQISQTVILSSYKINTVLKENFGIDIKVDRVGRALSKYAKQEHLKRLTTNIPKYELNITKYQKDMEEKAKNKENIEKKE